MGQRLQAAYERMRPRSPQMICDLPTREAIKTGGKGRKGRILINLPKILVNIRATEGVARLGGGLPGWTGPAGGIRANETSLLADDLRFANARGD